MVRRAVEEATGRKAAKRPKNDVSDREVVVLGSGNLGLVYLMQSERRLTLEEIDERHPELIRTLREHPHIGWLLVRSAEHGAVVLGPSGTAYLDEGRVEGDDPLAPFSPTAGRHLRRTDGFAHVADIMVGSFYDPVLDEGCAFEELISFHGGARRPADPAVPARAAGPPAAAGAHHRRRRGPSGAAGLAAGARRRRGHAAGQPTRAQARPAPSEGRRRAARRRGRARPRRSGTRPRACGRRRWPAS